MTTPCVCSERRLEYAVSMYFKNYTHTIAPIFFRGLESVSVEEPSNRVPPQLFKKTALVVYLHEWLGMEDICHLILFCTSRSTICLTIN